MRIDTPAILFEQMLQGLYSAETQLILALPRVAARADSPELREAIERHLEQTRGQVSRIERIADMLKMDCSGKSCLGMMGILKEGDEDLGYGGDPMLVDSVIIASSQKVEHYEIASYIGTLRLARDLGSRSADVMALLTETLEEEEETDEILNELAESLRAEGPEALTGG
ncbi:MAG: DUF892 family protein [Planctomycetota bacterium]|nr:DUF892 family protein [Planctomycetota bacterium]